MVIKYQSVPLPTYLKIHLYIFFSPWQYRVCFYHKGFLYDENLTWDENSCRNWYNEIFFWLERAVLHITDMCHTKPRIHLTVNTEKKLVGSEGQAKWLPVCRLHFQSHILVWKLLPFDSNFTEMLPNMWQATITTSVGLVDWHLYMSLGLNEFQHCWPLQ